MKSTTVPKVLILGHRKKAVRAVERLGFTVISCPAAPSPEILAQGPFVAVLASGESTVLPAAQTRQALGLPGPSLTFFNSLRDKVSMKEWARSRGIPCADFSAHVEGRTVQEWQKLFGKKLVIKERLSSGSRGMLISDDPEKISKALGPSKIVERFIPGKESSIESFVQNGEVVFCNLTDYHRVAHVNVLPGNFTRKEAEAIKELNRRTIEAFNIERGMVHLEYFMTSQGPILGELALRPPGGHLMDLLNIAYGIRAWSSWAKVELGIPINISQEHKEYVCAVILHPGPGLVTAVRVPEIVQSLPEIYKLEIKVSVGDQIKTRVGTGQEVGKIVLRSKDRKKLMHALEIVEREVHIKVQA